jgi:UDP-N-acetylmuramoyl-tripeptide--D-alanyl-D-alanine ligase
VRAWDAERIARAAGAELAAANAGTTPGAAVGPDPGTGAATAQLAGAGPTGVAIDSRALAPGELFVGLGGGSADGGSFAAQALRAGAWGVLVAPGHARDALAAGAGAVLVHEHPLVAFQALARAWRRELGSGGARVVAITGSSGKTSTKDILAALLAAELRTVATPANLNTEIGLPLTILGAPADTECLVLEMAMRGPGQIAELTAIAEPDIGIVVNVGPAHLELLGSLEAIAAAKAELIAGLAPGATAIVPAGEELLVPHLRAEVRTLTFGEGGDFELLERTADGRVRIGHGGEVIELLPSFSQAHNLRNLLAAVAAAHALGLSPNGPLEVRFSAMRGQRIELAGGVSVIDDCYNANPMSMRAAIDDLAETAAARRVAVLGDMLELGPQAPQLHREIGEHASARGVDLLVGVGAQAPELLAGFEGDSLLAPDAAAAAELLDGRLADGDTVLIKGSRGVGLELVVEALRAHDARAGAPRSHTARGAAAGAGSGRR